MNNIERTLATLTAVLEYYSEQMERHNSTIQELSRSSRDLAKTVTECERLLIHLFSAMEEKAQIASSEDN